MSKHIGWMLALAASAGATPAAAQTARVQSAAEALAQDAAEYARAVGVPQAEAERRLRAQALTRPATLAITRRFAGRLAGVSVEHRPDHRIVVLLTGDAPVPDKAVDTGEGMMPVVFRTGARATRAEVLGALSRHQAAIRAMLPHPPGLGHDARTGALVVTADPGAVDAIGADELARRVEALTGVPVRIRALGRETVDLAAEGGGRVVGVNPADGRRYACTTGFVVTDGARQGVVTAAHCPDALSYVGGDGAARRETPLAFLGQWGWGYQDVQLHLAAEPLRPLFLADTAKSVARPVDAVLPRDSTRAGDWVCHRGESTGYSCAEVEFADFAPAGDLCGGACLPTWVAVAGPTCRSGDSGGPVFVGTVAIGLTKGASYRDGRCGFYFYMSTDFLPTGWSVALGGMVPPTAP
jgi:hypothetical protein